MVEVTSPCLMLARVRNLLNRSEELLDRGTHGEDTMDISQNKINLEVYQGFGCCEQYF